MQDSEAALVAAAKAGSRPAFTALVRQHQHALRGFLRRLRADAADADDLAQEVFLAAWSHMGRFDGRSSFRSWLCAIAWRRLRDARRSATRRSSREGLSLKGRPTSGNPTVDQALDAASLLARLAPDQAAAVALCLGGDFSHAEAAEVLGLSLGTVKSHVIRGRAKLLKALESHDER